MYNDNSNLTQADVEAIGVKLLSGDLKNVHMIGDTCDRIYDKNGNLLDEIHGHNLVVDSFLKLVMCLIKRQDGYSGIQYWAVGSGASSWDSSLPNPDINATRLTAELGRVAISPSEIVFLNDDLSVSSAPTHIIQITHTFGVNDCNGVWREFGIFGGNATTSANSGLMINKRHHAVITKTNEMVVERVMRFTLSLV